MRVLLIILGIYFGNTCLFGQNNLKTVKRDSTSEQQRTLSSSDNFRSDINKLNTTIDSLKSDKADLKVVNLVKEDLEKRIEKMYFIFSGAIIIAMIIASLFTYFSFSQKINHLRKRVRKLEEEKSFLSNQINNNNEAGILNETSTINLPLKITAEVPLERFSVEKTSIPTTAITKTYFAGPDGAFFYSEFEHQENTPNKSLFEFMVNKDMPQQAKFSVLLTPYSLNTIINNSSVFEAVCEFSELNFEANYIDSQRPGKAKRTANGWQVIEKTKVRLGKT
jgi:cell division protein FtsL